MKNILSIILLLSFSVASFSQSKNRHQEFNKDYYFKKRSQNNTTAHFMLWGGLATSIIGSTIDQKENFDGSRGLFGFRTRGDHEYKHAGTAIAYTGLVLMAGSIPFFYFAANNKKKASSLIFKNETIPRVLNQDLVYSTVPSVSLIISL